MSEVLRGVRVVELASWTYVPAAGAALADWGADVIKVEDVRGGDPGRALVIGPFTKAAARAHVDFILEIGNRGKRSVAIDIKSETGREYFGRLLATADVFLTNWLPGPLERARLTVEDIRSFNPNIIIARGTGMGVRGPDRDKGGFDAATYLSRGGVAYTLTPFGEDPAVQGPAFGDLQGGITLAGGLCAALFHRERTGEPSIVDSSLLAQAMWSIAPSISVADLFDMDGIPGAPPGLAMNPLVNRYKTRDDRYIQLVFLQPDRYWAGFCTRIGLPELAEDPRFAPSSNLIANADAACALVGAAIASQDLEYWRKALEDEPGVWAALATPKETLNDPQVKPNGYVIPNVDADGNEYQIVAPPVQFNETPPAPSRAPEYGEHTEEILLGLDLDWDDISAAKDSGAIL
jgi:crotonobetainyl-CoA:carnitine CoA-transferase CaiB-like acyl-CoA transferase